MQPQLQQQSSFEIIQALKIALKVKKKTYKDVANTLNVSEQTIKRLFKEGDCSLSRLEQICSAISISVYDLLEMAQQTHVPQKSMTLDQQKYLAKHPEQFYLLSLLYMQYSPDDLMQQMQLQELQLFRLMKKLDDQKIIELESGLKFKFCFQGRLLFDVKGPLRAIILEINQKFLSNVIHGQADNHMQFSSSFRFLSPTTLSKMQNDFEQLCQLYRQQGYRDQNLLPKDQLIPVKWTVLSGPFNATSIMSIKG